MKGNIALYEKNLTIYHLYYAWFKFTCNHAPPPRAHPPGIYNFFSFLEVYTLPLGTQIETIPHPRAPDRPQMCFLLHLFDPYKSKTTRSVHNFCERFPEFIERTMMDVKV